MPPCFFPAWYDGLEKNRRFIRDKRYDVNIGAHLDDQKSLIRIFLFVIMFPDVQQISVINMVKNVEETQAAMLSQPLFLLWVPIIKH